MTIIEFINKNLELTNEVNDKRTIAYKAVSTLKDRDCDCDADCTSQDISNLVDAFKAVETALDDLCMARDDLEVFQNTELDCKK